MGIFIQILNLSRTDLFYMNHWLKSEVNWMFLLDCLARSTGAFNTFLYTSIFDSRKPVQDPDLSFSFASLFISTREYSNKSKFSFCFFYVLYSFNNYRMKSKVGLACIMIFFNFILIIMLMVGARGTTCVIYPCPCSILVESPLNLETLDVLQILLGL